MNDVTVTGEILLIAGITNFNDKYRINNLVVLTKFINIE